MNPKIVIGVMGPGENATETDCITAYQIGKFIASQKYVLLTGGRNAGIMEAALKGAKENKGLTIGILPDSDTKRMCKYVDIPIVTGMGNARNAINVLSSHLIVTVGEGPGTFSEIGLAIKTGKPTIACNLSKNSTLAFNKIANSNFEALRNYETHTFQKLFFNYINNI